VQRETYLVSSISGIWWLLKPARWSADGNSLGSLCIESGCKRCVQVGLRGVGCMFGNRDESRLKVKGKSIYGAG
jgi:hypothetical protein